MFVLWVSCLRGLCGWAGLALCGILRRKSLEEHTKESSQFGRAMWSCILFLKFSDVRKCRISQSDENWVSHGRWGALIRTSILYKFNALLTMLLLTYLFFNFKIFITNARIVKHQIGICMWEVVLMMTQRTSLSNIYSKKTSATNQLCGFRPMMQSKLTIHINRCCETIFVENVGHEALE